MKRKAIAAAAILAVCFSVLAGGCGPKETTSAGESRGSDAPAKDMGKYEFRIAAWWDGTPVGGSKYADRRVQLHKEAEEKYNCTIKYLYVPQGEIVQKLTASVMAKDPFADIVWLEANTAVPQLALSGHIMETDEYFDFNDPKWPKYGLQAVSFRNKHYGFVADIASTYGIWYNKGFFSRYNLPDLYQLQESGQWTWEKFAEIAKAATTDTNHDGKNETFGFAEVGWEPIVDRFIASNGQAVVSEQADGSYRFNVDNSAVKEAINFTVDLFHRGYKTGPEDFIAGNVAMFAGDGFWGSQTFQLDMDDEMGFVFFPKGPRADDYVCTSINTDVMCLPANSKRPADADLIFEAITDWDNLNEERLDRMAGWMYSEEDVKTCEKMFERCQLHKWRAFSDLESIFMEDIFYACVKNNTTLEKAVAEHLAEGQAVIDAVLQAGK